MCGQYTIQAEFGNTCQCIFFFECTNTCVQREKSLFISILQAEKKMNKILYNKQILFDKLHQNKCNMISLAFLLSIRKTYEIKFIKYNETLD